MSSLYFLCFLADEQGHGVCNGDVLILHVLLVLPGYAGDCVLIADHQNLLFSLEGIFPKEFIF